MRKNRALYVVLVSGFGVLTCQDVAAQRGINVVVDPPVANNNAAAAAAVVADTPPAPANPRLTAMSTVQLPGSVFDRARLAESANNVPCVEVATMMSISRTIDDTPLERPRALSIVQGERSAVLGRLGTLLGSNGFTETSRDIDTGELRASRSDENDARDELLFWVDGQAGDAARVRIYMQYGRYEKFWGQGQDGQRVHLTADEVMQRIGAVRTAVINLSSETL